MDKGRIAFKILTGKLTGKIYLRRPKHRLGDNIRMYLKELGVNTRNWVNSPQDTDYWRDLVNVEESLRVL